MLNEAIILQTPATLVHICVHTFAHLARKKELRWEVHTHPNVHNGHLKTNVPPQKWGYCLI